MASAVLPFRCWTGLGQFLTVQQTIEEGAEVRGWLPGFVFSILTHWKRAVGDLGGVDRSN